MKKYLVLVKGRNFRLPFLERRKTVTRITGFYTTRCVIASGPVAAERKAIDLIRRDSKLKHSVRNSRTDPAIMRVVQIREVKAFAPLTQGAPRLAVNRLRRPPVALSVP